MLFYSGNLLWLETRRRKATAGTPDVPGQPAKVRVLAVLTVGISNGCLLGIAAVLLATKWLPGVTGGVNSASLWLYYAVFLAVLGWTCWQGAAKAAVGQLKLCAMLLFSLPLCSVLSSVVPQTGLWPARDLAEATLELTALLLSFALFSGARSLKHRFAKAPADSIWRLGEVTIKGGVQQA